MALRWRAATALAAALAAVAGSPAAAAVHIPGPFPLPQPTERRDLPFAWPPAEGAAWPGPHARQSDSGIHDRGAGGGDIGSRIFNGQDVESCYGPARYNVQGIFLYDPDGSQLGICSGSLIAPDKVLTSGHCCAPAVQDPPSAFFRVGGLGHIVVDGRIDLASPDPCCPGTLGPDFPCINLFRSAISWTFYGTGGDFTDEGQPDTCVITLDSPAPPMPDGSTRKPAELCTEPGLDCPLDVYGYGRLSHDPGLTGLGFPDTLQTFVGKWMTGAECNMRSSWSLFGAIHPTNACGYTPNAESETMPGDCGAPWVDSEGYVVGQNWGGYSRVCKCTRADQYPSLVVSMEKIRPLIEEASPETVWCPARETPPPCGPPPEHVPAPNGECETARVMDLSAHGGCDIALNQDNTMAGFTSDTPFCADEFGFPHLSTEVWFVVKGTGEDMAVEIKSPVFGEFSLDSRVGVFSGSCDQLECVTANDDFCRSLSFAQWKSELGVDYYIVVGGFGGAVGVFDVAVSSPPAAPCQENTCGGAIHSDPHFVGFDGQAYDVDGHQGSAYALLSAPGLSVNALFGTAYTTGLDAATGRGFHPRGTWMTAIGITTPDGWAEVYANGTVLADGAELPPSTPIVHSGVGHVSIATWPTVSIWTAGADLDITVVAPPPAWGLGDADAPGYAHLDMQVPRLEATLAHGLLGVTAARGRGGGASAGKNIGASAEDFRVGSLRSPRFKHSVYGYYEEAVGAGEAQSARGLDSAQVPASNAHSE